MDTITYRLIESDYVAFIKTSCARKLAASVLIAAALIFAVVAARTTMSGTSFDLMPIFGGAAAGILFALIYILLIVPKNARTVFREQVSLSEDMTLSDAQAGFEITQKSGSFRMDWTNVVQWDETGNLVLIYPNRLMCIMLPKSQLGSERVSFIRGQLVDSGLPKRRKLRR